MTQRAVLQPRGNTLAVIESKNLILASMTAAQSETQIRGALSGENALNTDLINALKAAKIKDVYILADINFLPRGMIINQILVEALVKEGFNVHGVLTPSDCTEGMTIDALQSFHQAEKEMKEGHPSRHLLMLRLIGMIKIKASKRLQLRYQKDLGKIKAIYN